MDQEDFAEAENGGRELEVDSAAFYGILTDEQRDFLSDDVRFTEDGMTVGEAKDISKRLEKIDESQLKELFDVNMEALDNDRREASRLRVRDAVRLELMAAGRADENAAYEAELFSRLVAGLAKEESRFSSTKEGKPIYAEDYVKLHPVQFAKGKKGDVQGMAQALGVSGAQGLRGSGNYKAKQFDIIQRTNPMTDDYHTGIRSAEEIKTLKETLDDTESFSYKDYTRKDAERDIKRGRITVYSSKPIKDGTAVSPSRMMAQDYAGPNGKVHSADVPINCVAFINADEGVYADAREEWERKLDKHNESWNRRLTKLSENSDTSQGNMFLMNVPVVLSEVAGMEEGSILIHASKIGTIIKEHNQEIDKSSFKDLPLKMANPVMVLKSAQESTNPNSVNVVIKLQGLNNAPVFVNVSLNKKMNQKGVFYYATSMYTESHEDERGNRVSSPETFDKWVQDRLLLYVDETQFEDWKKQNKVTFGIEKDKSGTNVTRVQFPGSGQHIRSISYDVTTKQDLVNARAERNNKFYQILLHASKADGIIRFDHGFMGTGEGQQIYGWGTYGAMAQSVVDWYLKQFTEKTPQKLKLGGNDFNLSAPFEVIAENEYFKELKREDVSGVVTILRDIFGWPVEKGESFIGNVRAYIKHLPYTWISKESLERITNWLDKHEGDIEYVAPSVKEPHLYKFRAPDVIKGENYLDWDNAVSRSRLERIYEGLKEKHPEANIDGWSLKGLSRENFIQLYSNEYSRLATGGKLYKDLAEALGSQEAASKFLDSIGIVGNIYLDGISRNKGEGTYNFVIFNEDNAQIIEQLFQEADGEVRGTIDFAQHDGAPARISLFAKADASTVSHELGHWYLEELRRIAHASGDSAAGVSARVSEDLATLGSWWRDNAEDIARWANEHRKEGTPEVTAQEVQKYLETLNASGQPATNSESLIATSCHEYFARGFEAYLREGKAPTMELQGIFRRFKHWLCEVYKSVKELDVEISDDVRRVFDRMLASDEAVEQFRVEQEVAAALGLEGDTDVEDLRALYNSDSAVEAAQEALMVELFGELEPEKLKAMADRAEEIRPDVTLSVAQERAFAVIRMIEENPAMALSVSEVSEQFGDGVLETLRSELTSPEGLTLDVAAKNFGYGSSEELIADLQNKRSFRAEVDARVAAQVESEFGCALRDPDKLAAKAQAAWYKGEEHSEDLAADVVAPFNEVAQTREEYATDNIKAVFKAYSEGTDNKKFARNFQKVERWLADLVSRKLGVDISDYSHSIDNYAIRHIMKNHGNEKSEAPRGQVAITESDLLKIPEIINNPDYVVLGNKTYSNLDAIVYIKVFDNGKIYFVEELRSGRQVLNANTMWAMKKTGTSNGTMTLPPNVLNDTGTTEIIANPAGNVNTDSANSDFGAIYAADEEAKAAQENPASRQNVLKWIKERGKISYAAVKAVFGDEPARELMRKLGPGAFNKNGAGLDEIAAELSSEGVPIEGDQSLYNLLIFTLNQRFGLNVASSLTAVLLPAGSIPTLRGNPVWTCGGAVLASLCRVPNRRSLRDLLA